MRRVTPTLMRQRLGEILDAASAGERILIERDHKPLAYLVSVEDGNRLDDRGAARRERRLNAIRRAEAFAKRMAAEVPPEGWLGAAGEVRRDRARDAAAQR